MNSLELIVKTKVWIYEGPNPWYFITIPKNNSLEINKKFGHLHRGWGSIPVKVTLGKSTWKTSIFWEKKGTYIMPIKKEIRINENVKSGDQKELAILIENIA